jgi:hypothetical protein
MRYLFGFMCVLALGVMPLVGCSETSGEGGAGGTGRMPQCQSPEDCEDDNECTDDTCLAGVCEFMAVPGPTGPEEPGDPPGDGTTCGYYAGTCEGGSCVGTFACTEAGIREAIAAGAGPHGFDCAGPTTVVTAAEIVIDNDVILDGGGNLTVDGDEDHRVFFVDEGVTAELHGLTVARGHTSPESSDIGIADGGGIDNRGTLTLTNCTVTQCSVPPTLNPMAFANGGGISNGGTLTLTNCTVSENAVDGSGGGIYSGGTLTMTNSTVSGNSYPAIWNHHDGVMTIASSTVSDTGVPGDYFGDITNLNVPEAVTLANSIVDGDCSRGADDPLGRASFTSLGYNIESPGDTCGFDQTGDLVNITEGQLDLGPLAYNGGPTMTHALGAGSVAIDHIPAVDCGVTTDQRGAPRFVGGRGPLGQGEPVGDGCDVGAFEVQPPAAESCTQSGGTVSTGLCCQAVESFPNTCAIGACGCAPDASHEVAFCICPTNTCFDGESCVAQ